MNDCLLLNYAIGYLKHVVVVVAVALVVFVVGEDVHDDDDDNGNDNDADANDDDGNNYFDDDDYVSVNYLNVCDNVHSPLSDPRFCRWSSPGTPSPDNPGIYRRCSCCTMVSCLWCRSTVPCAEPSADSWTYSVADRNPNETHCSWRSSHRNCNCCCSWSSLS